MGREEKLVLHFRGIKLDIWECFGAQSCFVLINSSHSPAFPKILLEMERQRERREGVLGKSFWMDPGGMGRERMFQAGGDFWGGTVLERRILMDPSLEGGNGGERDPRKVPGHG